MKKVLVISRDVVRKEMAGPGIRCYQIAKTLAKILPAYHITLTTPQDSDLKEDFEIVTYGNRISNFKHFRESDFVISQEFTPQAIFGGPIMGKKLILDLYDPLHIEQLELDKDMPFKKRVWLNRAVTYNLMIRLIGGDFIMCSNERQRDLWLGMMSALGLIDAKVYQDDPTLRKYIDIVTYGVRPDPLKKTKDTLKGINPQIASTDKVLIWNGGVWNWFDPLTLIKAMKEVSRIRNDVKLFFLGTKHPNPEIKEMWMLNEAVDLSRKLGLFEKEVIFNFGWVPYEETKNYLLEADLGVSTYTNHLETHFAHRTRVLDLIWAEKPIICTKGDYLSDLVENNELGIVVEEKNIKALIEAILRLVSDKTFYEKCIVNIRKTKETLSWEKTLLPLVNFIERNESIAPPFRKRFIPLFSRFSYTILYRIAYKLLFGQ